MNIKQLNNLVIQEVIKQILSDLKLRNDKQKSNIKSLDLETAIYGQRPMIKIPGNMNINTNKNDKSEVDKRFDELISARKPTDEPPKMTNFFEPVNIEVLPEKDFNDKLSFLKQQRNSFDHITDIKKDREDYDPRAFYMDMQKKKDENNDLSLQNNNAQLYTSRPVAFYYYYYYYTSRQVEPIKAPQNMNE